MIRRWFCWDDLNRFGSDLKLVSGVVFGLRMRRFREVDSFAEDFSEFNEELRAFSDNGLNEKNELVSVNDFVVIKT